MFEKSPIAHEPHPEKKIIPAVPKIETYDSIDAALAPVGASYEDAEREDPQVHAAWLSRMGLLPGAVEIRKAMFKNKECAFVRSRFRTGIDVLQIIKLKTVQKSQLSDQRVEIMDAVFISESNGKTFRLKSLSPTGIVVDNDSLGAWAHPLDEQIELVPIGEIMPKRHPLAKLILHYYKRIEPLIIFHELAHCEQDFRGIMSLKHGTQPDTLQLNKNQNYVLSERDAWRYAIQCIRELRRQGIDLLPDLGNSEIINYINLVLIGMDASYPYPLYRNFSRLLKTRSTLPSLAHSEVFYRRTHPLRIAKAMLRTVASQPSLVTEGIGALLKR